MHCVGQVWKNVPNKHPGVTAALVREEKAERESEREIEREDKISRYKYTRAAVATLSRGSAWWYLALLIIMHIPNEGSQQLFS